MQALLIRLKPAGPWRLGSETGAAPETALLYHSDSLYSAVCQAMGQLGQLSEWLRATAVAAGAPAVRFSSCFPWIEDTLLVVPPRNIWPPAALRLRANRSRFAPLSLVVNVLRGEPIRGTDWAVDAPSRCVVPKHRAAGPPGPFRPAVRYRAAVDRVSGTGDGPSRLGCLEFTRNAGLWAVAAFTDEEAVKRWQRPVQAAFRLLGDTGFGGGRSMGWGRSEEPVFTAGELPGLLVPPLERRRAEPGADASEVPETPANGYWFLSLFHPGADDAVDWNAGDYRLLARGGRIETGSRWGAEKRLVRMVEEGSVLRATHPPVGSVADVAPSGLEHPVFRAGYAVSIPIPVRMAS